jgi:hypothetical protein
VRTLSDDAVVLVSAQAERGEGKLEASTVGLTLRS